MKTMSLQIALTIRHKNLNRLLCHNRMNSKSIPTEPENPRILDTMTSPASLCNIAVSQPSLDRPYPISPGVSSASFLPPRSASAAPASSLFGISSRTIIQLVVEAQRSSLRWSTTCASPRSSYSRAQPELLGWPFPSWRLFVYKAKSFRYDLRW